MFILRGFSFLASDPPTVVFHQDLFKSVAIFFIVCMLWGFFLFLRGQPPSGSYNGALVIGVALIAIQCISGLVLFFTGHHPHEIVHWVYGIVLLLTIPIVYGAWNHARNDKLASLYYALGCLLIVLIVLVRVSATGSS